jgi:hypothetical protein
MHALLIAAVTDIDLQRIKPPAPDRRKRDVLQERPRVSHVGGL